MYVHMFVCIKRHYVYRKSTLLQITSFLHCEWIQNADRQNSNLLNEFETLVVNNLLH